MLCCLLFIPNISLTPKLAISVNIILIYIYIFSICGLLYWKNNNIANVKVMLDVTIKYFVLLVVAFTMEELGKVMCCFFARCA